MLLHFTPDRYATRAKITCMAFCSNCGGQIADDARFCGTCGNPVRPTGVPGATTGPSAGGAPYQQQPLEYTIQGDNLQIARVSLKPGQEVYAEAGKMLYKTANVQWDTRMTGGSISEKLLGAIRRKLAGDSLFVTYFRADGNGEVGFAGGYPGKIQAIDLHAGQAILAQRDTFLFAQPSVTLTVAMVRRLGTGFFGGDGFILERLVGPGLVFIHAGGDFIEFNLSPGEKLQVSTGCIVAFDESVDYNIEFVGGIKTAIFGGEGLFLATLTGPGRVIVQSMTLEKMRRELSDTHAHSNDQHNKPLGSLGAIFGSGEE
jgi:uncharacterized protein (TIGR00266 family)